MGLEIQFLDGAPVMELGATTRIKVMSRDAEGDLNATTIANVTFAYTPLEWARVRPTDDPAIGVLEVTRVVESEDLLLAPTFGISASLTAQAGQAFTGERRVRLLATAIEVEIGFEVGQYGKFRRFLPSELKRAIDWTKVTLGDPATQTLVVRDGRPYLRLASLDALPANVSITMPNGEVVALKIEGTLGALRPGESPVRAPVPAPAPAPALAPAPAPVAPAVSEPTPDAGVEVAATEEVSGEVLAPPALAAPAPVPDEAGPTSLLPIRDEVARLRRYVGSFTGTLRGRPDPRTAEGIRQRITREVECVKALVERHTGPDRDELLAAVRQAAVTA